MYDYTSTKYKIHLSFHTDGLVERPDVVGAIFGQTEGLLGEELDLRELQRMGKVGRIDVQLQSSNGEADGSIAITSALDLAETAVLAASMETIERIGPCTAMVEVATIEDIRVTKRNQIRDRAKTLVFDYVDENSIDTETLIKEIRESQRIGRITTYGPEELPAGSHINQSDAIILVEGRADVLNLLRVGIKNTLAVQGTNIPQTVVDICRQKIVTTLFDGDRGGDLILQELLQIADIDFVGFATRGVSVENMTRKEIIKALRNKVPIEYLRSGQVDHFLKLNSLPPLELETDTVDAAYLAPHNKERKNEEGEYQIDIQKPYENQSEVVLEEEKDRKNAVSIIDKMWNVIDQTINSGDLTLLDQKGELIFKGKSDDVIKVLTEVAKENADANMLIVDKPVTQALVDLAVNTHLKVFAAPLFAGLVKQPVNIQLISFST
jgi:DNA primase